MIFPYGGLVLAQGNQTESQTQEKQEADTDKSSPTLPKDYYDIDSHWAKKEIEKLIDKGIVTGRKQNGVLVIDPSTNVTRAEFISMLVKSQLESDQLEQKVKEVAQSSFSDTKDHWATNLIEVAKNLQITKGYPDGTFQPNKKISRAEIIAAVVRAYDLKANDEDSTALGFTDLSEQHWAYPSIRIAVVHQLTSGYPDQTFKPDAFATRAEGMVILSKSLSLERNSQESLLKLKANPTSFLESEKVSLWIEEQDPNLKYEVKWQASGGKLEVKEDQKSAAFFVEKGETATQFVITVTFTVTNEEGKVQEFEKSISLVLKKPTTSYVGANSSHGGGGSGGGNVGDGNTGSVATIPEAPTLSIAETGGQLVLSWNAVQGAQSYTVKRGESGGQYTVLAKNLTELTYTDLSRNPGTTYFYVVTANNLKGSSQHSNEVVYKTAPKAPVVFGKWENGTAKLNWTKANGADRYRLYRSTVSGGPYFVLSENLIGTSYEDAGLIEGTKYYYVIKSINSIGESNFSSEIEVSNFMPERQGFIPAIDEDGDGLTNDQELTYGTDFRKSDTDQDGLTDAYEIQIGTNPLDPDTDGDGLFDGAETIIGSNPLTADSNKTATKQAQTNDGTISVVAEGDGNLVLAPLQVQESDNTLINSLEGIVGKAVDITAGGYPIEKAAITFRYDENLLNGTVEEDLTVFYVNPDTKKLEPLSDVTVDATANTVTAGTTHFSMYLLGNKNMPVDLAKVDIVFVIDQSGSMYSNDPNEYRIQATKKFIEQMSETHNRIGLVGFSSNAYVESALSSNKQSLLQVIDNFYFPGGGTNIPDGMRKGGDLYNDNTRKKVMVLLSDGETSYENQVLPLAQSLAANSVVVNTIALGSGADEQLMQEIATTTKGGYFYIDNTGGLSQEDVDKQIQLIYEKLAKQLTFQLEVDKNSSIPSVSNIEFSDLYKGLDFEEVRQWMTQASSNLLTGNYMEQHADLKVESPGIDLVFERTYNSLSSQDQTVLGNGWRMNFDSKLEDKANEGVVKPSVLNVRNGAYVKGGTASESVTGFVIGQVTAGTTVDILQKDAVTDKQGRKWHKVSYKNKEAFVAEWYVKETNVAEVTYPSGTKVGFEKNPDGTFKTPSGVYDQLAKLGNEYVLTQKDQTKYVYDQKGKLVRIEDRNGNALTVYYSGNKVSKITDPVGRELVITYTNNFITKVTGPNGKSVSYAYDSRGNLTKVTDLAGNDSTYTYDQQQDRINKVTDANGHQVVRNEYDLLGRLVRQYDGQDNIKYFIYDDSNRERFFIDENGKESKAKFNQDLRSVEEIDAIGGKSEHSYYVEYNGNWVNITDLEDGTSAYENYVDHIKPKQLRKKEEAIDKNGNKTIQVFDQRNNLIKVTDAKNQVMEMTYDASDNLLTRVDNRGNSTEYVYDAARMNLVKEIDALGNAVEYTYFGSDPTVRIKGLVKTVKDKRGNFSTYKYEDSYNNQTAVIDALGQTTSQTSDVYGRVIESLDANGNVNKYTYDDMGRLTSIEDALGFKQRIEYDAVGNKSAEVDQKGNRTEYTYDQENQLIKVTNPLGNETTYQYDNVGNKMSETDPKGAVTNFSYDALYRLISVEDALQYKTTYEYDQNGNKMKETDAQGRETQFEYDPLNQLVKTIDPLGFYEEIQYDENGNIIAQRDKRGNWAYFSFDDLNRMISEQNALGYSITRMYDENGNVIQENDPLNRVTTSEYDPLNRKVKEIAPMGKTTLYAYDANGNPTQMTDSLGNVSETQYDALNRKKKFIDAKGNETSFEYDAVGLEIQMTDALGNISTKEYDAVGHLIKETNALGQTTTYTYDDVGNRISERNLRGAETQYKYDLLNRVIRVTDAMGEMAEMEYDAVGNNTAKVDKRGNRTEYTYDQLNRNTSVIDPYGNRMQYSYDEEGNKTSFTDAKQNTTSYHYDELNQLVSETDPLGYTKSFEYDPVGNKVAEVDRKGKRTQFVYDDLNRLIKVIDPEVTETTYTYDLQGNLLSQTDGENRTITFEYDELYRPVKRIDSAGKEEMFTYDSVGNLINKVDRKGQSTEFTYDPLNRLVKLMAGNLVNSYKYDDAGNRIEDSNALGTTTYRFDLANRVTRKTLPDSSTISYTYDSEGNVTSVTDPTGYTVNYTYDNMNRMSTVSTDDGMTSYSYDENGNRSSLRLPNGTTTTYEYDTRNLLTRLTNTIQYRSTKANQPVQLLSEQEEQVIEEQPAEQPIEDPVVPEIQPELDPVIPEVGIPEAETEGADKPTTLVAESLEDGQDPLVDSIPEATEEAGETKEPAVEETTESREDSPAEKTVTPGNETEEVAPPSDIEGGSTPADDKASDTSETTGEDVEEQKPVDEVSETEQSSNLVNEQMEQELPQLEIVQTMDQVPTQDATTTYVYEYGYDKNGLQTFKIEPKGKTEIEYDDLGRVKRVTEPDGRVTTYAYDQAGNRKSQSVNGDGLNVDITYTYDERNRLVETVERRNGDTYTTEYSYDENGNQIKVVVNGPAGTKVSTYNYDELNRLDNVVTPDGKTIVNKYNVDGLRVQKNVDGQVTTYYYSGKQVIIEKDQAGDGYHNIQGINLIARNNSNGTFYYLYNGHADVVHLLDQDGLIVNTYDYDIFGNHMQQDEGEANPYRYSGYMYDDETGYYYLRARYYDPEIARFITEDTYRGTQTDPLSLNMYTYAQNDPLIQEDPDGNLAWFVPLIIGAAVGGVIELASQAIDNHSKGKKVFDKDNYNWKNVGKAAVVGGVTAMVPVSRVWQAAALGSTSTVSLAAWKGDVKDAGDVAFYAGVGAVLGGTTKAVSSGFSQATAKNYVKNASKTKLKADLRKLGNIKGNQINKAKADLKDLGSKSKYFDTIKDYASSTSAVPVVGEKSFETSATITSNVNEVSGLGTKTNFKNEVYNPIKAWYTKDEKKDTIDTNIQQEQRQNTYICGPCRKQEWEKDNRLFRNPYGLQKNRLEEYPFRKEFLLYPSLN
ncbi:S-layer homology domain-containing protein [Ammoniphilus resinae]|nr:S-layer homology domain-containing protein [Ammoniphilus resinae]